MEFIAGLFVFLFIITLFAMLALFVIGTAGFLVAFLPLAAVCVLGGVYVALPSVFLIRAALSYLDWRLRVALPTALLRTGLRPVLEHSLSFELTDRRAYHRWRAYYFVHSLLVLAALLFTILIPDRPIVDINGMSPSSGEGLIHGAWRAGLIHGRDCGKQAVQFCTTFGLALAIVAAWDHMRRQLATRVNMRLQSEAARLVQIEQHCRNSLAPLDEACSGLCGELGGIPSQSAGDRFTDALRASLSTLLINPAQIDHAKTSVETGRCSDLERLTEAVGLQRRMIASYNALWQSNPSVRATLQQTALNYRQERIMLLSAVRWADFADLVRHIETSIERLRTLSPFYEPTCRPHFDALGLPYGPFDARTLRRAYHRMALRLHPDRGGNVADFIRVRRAYEALVSLLP